MRLLTVLPPLSTRARPVAQLAAIAFMLAGCSTVGGGPAAPAYSPPSARALGFAPRSPSPSVFYLTNGIAHSVRRDYVDRYACASGVPLACTCMSRLSEACDCRC
jgi:hypothetical protein